VSVLVFVAASLLQVVVIGSKTFSEGMGEVYRVRDTRLDRIVAIKVLPAQLATDPQIR
jgi:serine/threonine protein kinase